MKEGIIMSTDNSITIMVGLPRSGKSSKAKEFQDQGATILCPDVFRIALHGHTYLPSAENIIWATIELTAKALVMQGHSIVIDATNITKFSRSKWIKLAKDLKVPAYIVWMKATKELCLERNTGAGSVPNGVIERMDSSFQDPTVEEAFITTYE